MTLISLNCKSFKFIYVLKTKVTKLISYINFSLAVCDCLLIIDSFVQRSIIPYFTSISPNEPKWFILMYPYFWYPFRGIIVTVTIYMMLAISAERFRAVCYPLSKRHVSQHNMLKHFTIHYFFLL